MLHGKTALVTGGSSGIGLAAAKALRDNGARVAVAGRSSEKLHRAIAELGGEALAIQADVSSLDDLSRMRGTLQEAFGSLDILFANAGIALATPLATADEETYHRIMDANVKSVFFTVQAVLPLMRDGGSIVLNTSWLNQVGMPGRAILSASKAAVRSFARTMSAELIDRKIRVNAVSPGSIETPIHRGKNQSEEEFRAYADRVGAQVPIGRMGRPEEIACAVLFLASDASSYMLGTEIVVDGGRSEL
ncbi:glucose 1-dehydrogenase [Rhizobium leucaenae]|uniref:NAD(P)-dependent dehydrogenase (Short-subunit alcohol dehydrogenase family) n=1 Tax=Rhizobium leucaenae TaxID=29450 RepID=A0A7W6ZVB8_9HYPH|nr:glucose 1-dehydrogenase [Rhizobium leucaenae]MBB4569314.1 NAD(P)-dependent dehydrogenase (short-subunit alcohol dehydrogenase family) [Rhizobium leucaenae]MBB6302766.1 NAD(P)-dependent dehydrogenase (short-subunit alcohol dehydrogenase family) [Rhizobium leucaenae]